MECSKCKWKRYGRHKKEREEDKELPNDVKQSKMIAKKNGALGNILEN